MALAGKRKLLCLTDCVMRLIGIWIVYLKLNIRIVSSAILFETIFNSGSLISATVVLALQSYKSSGGDSFTLIYLQDLLSTRRFALPTWPSEKSIQPIFSPIGLW